MDKKYIQENEIDIKYLRGQLADDELEQFEVYLMENPEYLESLEIDSLLLSSELKSSSNVEPSHTPRGLWAMLTQSLNLVYASTFSVVVLAMALAWLMPSFFLAEGEHDRAGIYAVELENFRSASDTESQNMILLSKLNRSKELSLSFFLPDELPEVEVSVLKDGLDGFHICNSAHEPIAKGKVALRDLSYSFLVPSSKLSEGNFTVCVSNIDGLINNYRVSVVKEK